MVIYSAPLEGVTTWAFRRIHNERFSGIDKYFIPFVSPASHLTFASRVQYELAPENNAGFFAVAQILAKDASLFNSMAKMLCDIGYGEVNLNLGCPSSTVTAKGKGSGMLKCVDSLARFLDEIYAHPVVPVSVKTRVGYDSTDDWPLLARLFMNYPISEITLHLRTRDEMYSGAPHFECLKELENAKFGVICNGDIFTPKDCESIMNAYPFIKGVMLGRGLISNPALAREIRGGQSIDKSSLRGFHDALLDAYSLRWPQNAVVARMHEFINYTVKCFDGADKQLKAIRKSRKLDEYKDCVDRLFEECPLSENPRYRPD